MSNSTPATTIVATPVSSTQAVQLLPIASSAKFDVRLGTDGSLLLYREDTGACIVDLTLSSEQIAQIKAAQSAQ